MSSVPPVDEGAQEAGTFTSTSQEDFPSTSLPSAPEDEPRSSPLDTQTIEEIFNDAHPPTSRQARASSSNEDDSQADNHFFQCNICFDPVRQPVVTLCGHLFWYAPFDSIFSSPQLLTELEILPNSAPYLVGRVSTAYVAVSGIIDHI